MTWLRATESERPVVLLRRLLRERHHADFADYCAAAADLPRFCPAVHERFGGRALTARVSVPTDGAGPADALEHLSCRYYRLDLPPGSARLTAELRPESAGGPCHLRAALIVPRADPHPPEVTSARPWPEPVSADVPADGLGYAVLVVVNTFVPESRLRVHDHAEQRFRFAAWT